MTVSAALTEEECYLVAILGDESGLDLAEWTWTAAENDDNCFRAWPFQWSWWKCDDPLQINQCARSIGKSLSIKVRGFAFPFVHPGQEMVITAPELVHLEPIVNLIETQIDRTRLSREIRRKPATHRPFMMEFHNGARIIGRIPQRTGAGIKGCVEENTLVLTRRGIVPAVDVVEGDEVWSHELRWSPVVGVDSFEDEGFEMKGQGSRATIVNGRHTVYGRWNRNTSKQARDLGPQGWATVRAIMEGDNGFHWTTSGRFPEEHSLDVPPILATNGNARSGFDLDSASFWWVVGRWLADGYGELQKLRGGGLGRGRVNFVVHPDDQEPLLKRLADLGMTPTTKRRDYSSADVVQVCSTSLILWLYEHFGKLAQGKKLHPSVLFLSDELRRATLEGYLSGDGTHTDCGRARHAASSASAELVLGIGLLGQSLNYAVGYSQVQPKITHIMGVALKKPPRISYKVNLSWRSTGPVTEGNYVSYKVRSCKPVGTYRFINIVSRDHSYLANGIFHHNTHPLWLEQDEASDYPENGWREIIETLKRGQEGAMWRASGVTRGLRDSFYKNSQHGQDDPPLRYISHKDDGHWTVHRICAMARPNWTDEERQEKIMQYGSRDDPDFRRNVLGNHGDSQSPILVLRKLMAGTDDDPSTEFNTDEYWNISIKDTEVDYRQVDILDLLNPPLEHKKYKTTWIGADIGFTNDPTEILIFAEYPMSAEEKREVKARGKVVPVDGASRIKLIGRVTLRRIGAPAQADVIEELVNFYNPQAFAMDAGGNGLPLFQQIQRRMEDVADVDRSVRARKAAESIKGYKFDQKIVVEFDETVELPDNVTMDERIKLAGIQQRVLEAATDVIRTYVDEGRIWLPWDTELLSELQGQSFSYSKSELDRYGRRRRVFSQGNFHAFDAMRFGMIAHKQFAIEALINAREPETGPVLDMAIYAEDLY